MERIIREMLSRGVVDPVAAGIWISFCLLLDLMTLVLEVARNIKGSGPSGIPVIPWFIYCYMVFFSSRPVPFFGHPEVLFRFLNLVALTGFHLLCHYTLPAVHLRWIERKGRV